MQGQSLLYRFEMMNIATKLIVINVVIFLLVSIVSFLMQINPSVLTSWFELPEELNELIFQPWSLITYSFLHGGFWHILFNMLWLSWFSRIILNLFSEQRFLTIYLLGALYGGLLFVIGYNLFPVFQNDRGSLIGASAAVSAIMVFIATYSPNTEMRIFMFNIKLWHIALTLFVLDLVRLGSGANAGGMLSHIGGAIFGYVYAIQMAKGNDIGKWFENFLNWGANLFKPRKKKPFKKVHRNQQKTAATQDSGNAKSTHQKQVDAILDKIGKSGYDSLTKAEKDFLFKAGKD